MFSPHAMKCVESFLWFLYRDLISVPVLENTSVYFLCMKMSVIIRLLNVVGADVVMWELQQSISPILLRPWPCAVLQTDPSSPLPRTWWLTAKDSFALLSSPVGPWKLIWFPFSSNLNYDSCLPLSANRWRRGLSLDADWMRSDWSKQRCKHVPLS